MKIFKKLYFLSQFYRLFLTKTWCKSETKIDNQAGSVILNPDVGLDIPKIIWVYWQGKRPSFVDKCLRSIQAKNSNYQVRMLNPENTEQYCHIDWSQYPKITPQQKADLLRFDLLYEHGGIWLDASILIYENLDWIQELIDQQKTASFAYYRAKNTTRLDSPIIENWLLATAPKQPLFKAWFEELVHALAITPKCYIQDLKQNDAQSANLFQNIGNLEYLVAYVACQKIMRTIKPSISLVNCDENALAYQVKNRWVKEKVLIELAVTQRPQPFPYLIKLTKKERNFLEKFDRHQRYFKGSLLDV